MSKTINLSQGKFAIVDDEDYEKLNKFKWYAHKHRNTYYAARTIKKPPCGFPMELMHRTILGAKTGEHVDHVNGDGFDNRRSNLRICSRSENLRNQRVHSNNKSGYKGVYWESSCNRWVAQVRLNGKKVYRKRFFCLMKAVRAYNEAAIKYHGEFAKINKI